MTEQENRNILEQWIQCINSNDTETLLGLVHDDYIEEYPQSGERIRGKDNFKEVYENFQNLPEVKGYNIHCCGDLGIVEMLLDYPDGGVYNACEILQFRDGKIASAKAYFGQPFEAQNWRSEWVEMMGDNSSETYDNPAPRAQ